MSSRIDGAGDGGIPHIEKPSQVVEPVTPPAEIPEKFPPKEGQARPGGTPATSFDGDVEPRRYFTLPNEAGTFDHAGNIVMETVALTQEQASARNLNWDDGKDVFETIA